MHPAELPLYWRALHLPKQGNTDDEYEDAWGADADRGRFVLADGASESAFAGQWARLLADGFLAAPRPHDLATWLGDARRRWSADVMDLELPWYAEMKRAEGAFATLLGLRVRAPVEGGRGQWEAVAVGDTCLVQVRGGRPILSFPLKQSSDFGNQPALIGSQDGPLPEARRARGSLLPGDRLFLMTDALAQWFLRAGEQGLRPWQAAAPLLTITSPEDDFAAWIEELRGGDGMRDDDVTLIIIEVGLAPEE
jgi:hypothetical protein